MKTMKYVLKDNKVNWLYNDVNLKDKFKRFKSFDSLIDFINKNNYDLIELTKVYAIYDSSYKLYYDKNNNDDTFIKRFNQKDTLMKYCINNHLYLSEIYENEKWKGK